MSELGLGSSAGSCRKASLAIFLLFLGIGLVIGGMDVVVRRDKSHGLALVFLGVMVLIPGGYNSYKVIKACRGEQGFDSIPDV